MLKTIGQMINDVRREKQISLAKIAVLGISKSRYYRFIDGEIDMPMFDIMPIMDALTLSFAELANRASGSDDQDTDLRRLIFAYALALREGNITPDQDEAIFQRLVTLGSVHDDWPGRVCIDCTDHFS